jgi:hypothetical protein
MYTKNGSQRELASATETALLKSLIVPGAIENMHQKMEVEDVPGKHKT